MGVVTVADEARLEWHIAPLDETTEALRLRFPRGVRLLIRLRLPDHFIQVLPGGHSPWPSSPRLPRGFSDGFVLQSPSPVALDARDGVRWPQFSPE